MAANLLALACRHSRPWRSATIAAKQVSRGMHQTAPMLKKKSKSPAVADEDVFAEADEDFPEPSAEDDLFGGSDTATAAFAPSLKPRVSSIKPKLSEEERAARFDRLREYVSQRIGPRPAIRREQIRHSAWIHMLDLATSPERVEQVVEMFPLWKESGKEFGRTLSETLVHRCEELSCPLIALRVFTNFQKYNVPLGSLRAGRELLQALRDYDVEHAVTLSTLYPLYGLKTLSDDPPSAALLAAICLRDQNATTTDNEKADAGSGTKRSRKEAAAARRLARDHLLPRLKRTWASTTRGAQEEAAVRALAEEIKKDRLKPKVWREAVDEMREALEKEKRDAEWLNALKGADLVREVPVEPQPVEAQAQAAVV